MSTLLDGETVDLLADDPELLAIADALVATRPRRRRRAPFVAGAAIAAGLALAFLAPWSGGTPALAHALTALGSRPVVHVIARAPTPRGEVQTETWYDTAHRILHAKIRRNGKLTDDFVVRTFTWVSRSRIVGFVAVARGPLLVAPPGTWVTGLPSPELLDFTTRYRDVLKSGRARVAGRGTIAGRAVVWIEFRRPIWTTRIAVDATTYKPVLLRTLVAGKRRGPDLRILVAETVPYRAADFRAPRHSVRPRRP
jgi:hypothetical protein